MAGTTGLTWREVVLAGDKVRAQMPATSLPSDVLDPLDCSRPTFFGHYWMRAPLVLQGPMLACADASVAKGARSQRISIPARPDLRSTDSCTFDARSPSH
jgi:hypothetical protein